MQYLSNTIPIESPRTSFTLSITVTLCVIIVVSLATIGCVDIPYEDNTTVEATTLTGNEGALLESGINFLLPEGIWVKIHEQKADDTVYFSRQPHGGSAFDTQRGQLILFGSDTHGKDWTNSPYVFNTKLLEWQQLHPNDKPGTYRVNRAGIPVSGKNGQHPWAMHTFGAVTYNPVSDQLIVSSYPAHLEPGRFTNALVHLWPQIRRHPTWILDLSSGHWKPLDTTPVHFFAYATTFDTDRNVVIGYKMSGIYELTGHPPHWKQITDTSLLGWHNNIAYDSCNEALIVFGSHANSNDIAVYNPTTREHRTMPTSGLRPPKDQHTPMAFHPKICRTVIVVDRKIQNDPAYDRSNWTAETWLYDYSSDRWSRVLSATFQFGLSMNYNMEYDPIHNVLLLVTSEPSRPTSVWALRLTL